MLFTLKPNPDDAAEKSKEFFKALIWRAEQDMNAAEVRMNDAYEKYSDDDLDWTAAQVIAQAESNFDCACDRYKTALLRYDWECKRQWMRKIIAPLSKIAPWLTDREKWIKIFRKKI
jgi:hypothetical protein